jgi:hypothetical protein
VSFDDLPKPEPKPEDERRWMELQHMAERAVLKGEPYGAERCDNCLYYLDETKSISYCWHPQLRILVGGAWWCQWWETAEEETATGTAQAATNAELESPA